MTIHKIMREQKQHVKALAIVSLCILMAVLFVGSWRAKMDYANQRIDESWDIMSFSLKRRQDLFADLILYIRQNAPNEKNVLQLLSNSYQSLPQAVERQKVFSDLATNKSFAAEHLAASELTYKVARYTWQQSRLSGNKQYYEKLKNLYFVTYQVKNTQVILNQEIDFYNRSLHNMTGTLLNFFFRYPTKLPLEEMVGRQMSMKEFMGEA